MTQNNLETTAVGSPGSPPTSDSDYHSTAKLKLGDPLGLPWEAALAGLLELLPHGSEGNDSVTSVFYCPSIFYRF